MYFACVNTQEPVVCEANQRVAKVLELCELSSGSKTLIIVSDKATALVLEQVRRRHVRTVHDVYLL